MLGKDCWTRMLGAWTAILLFASAASAQEEIGGSVRYSRPDRRPAGSITVIERPPAVGTVVRRPPPGYRPAVYGNTTYYIYNNVYYLPQKTGAEIRYLVVRPPTGAVLPALPPGARPVIIDQRTYYSCDDGAYYLPQPGLTPNYIVIDPPRNAPLYRLPDNCETIVLGPTTYYRVGRAYYRPYHRKGQVIYLCIDPPRIGRITGTLSYRERMALPPNAIVQVRLLDVTRGDPSIAGEQLISSAGRQAPFSFEILYDQNEVQPNRRYELQAQIIVHNRPWFMETVPWPRIGPGNPYNVDLILNSVR